MSFLKKDNKTALLFDLSDTHVGIALASIAPNQKPYILHTQRIPITTTEDEITSKHKESRVLSNLKKGLSTLSNRIHLHSGFLPKKSLEVDLVICVLSAPWYRAEARTFVEKYETPVTVNEIFLNGVLRSEMGKFKNLIIKSDDDKEVRYAAIEHDPVGVFINSYHTRKPVLKKANDISITFYLSAAKEDFLYEIDKVIHMFVHPKKFKFATFPYVFFKCIPSIFPDSTHGVLLHVAGEHTDVSFMTHNDLTFTDTIDVGRNHIIRSVMRKMKVPAEVAVSYCEMLERGQGNKTLREDIGSVTEKPIADFLKKAKEKTKVFLKQYQDDDIGIYLISDEEITHLLGQAINNEEEKIFSHIHMFSDKTLYNAANYKPHAEENYSLALLALYAQKIL